MPLFIKAMTFKEKVSGLLEEALLEKPSLFLIDVSISDSFKITVTLDGDSGVALQDCIDISRFIENNLDRDSFLLETNKNKIMTRPICQLIFKSPLYSNFQRDAQQNAIYLEERIVNIPSSVRQ